MKTLFKQTFMMNGDALEFQEALIKEFSILEVPEELQGNNKLVITVEYEEGKNEDLN